MDNSRLPDDYMQVGTCHCCKHVFIFQEYDQGDQYYCTLDAPERPICMSVFMEGEYYENTEGPGDKKWKKHLDDWRKWSEGREVHGWGYCGNHINKED